VDGDKHVTPDMWLEYRKLHKFRGPNCLCPLLRTTNEEPPSTEAKIVLKESGNHIGEYIAKCPNARCGYYGQLPVAFQDNESITKQKKNSSFGTKVCFIWDSCKNLFSER
jgi:hypothetical protein